MAPHGTTTHTTTTTLQYKTHHTTHHTTLHCTTLHCSTLHYNLMRPIVLLRLCTDTHTPRLWPQGWPLVEHTQSLANTQQATMWCLVKCCHKPCGYKLTHALETHLIKEHRYHVAVAKQETERIKTAALLHGYIVAKGLSPLPWVSEIYNNYTIP